MSRERLYWMCIGCGAVALLVAVFFWVMPVLGRIGRERDQIEKLRGPRGLLELLDKSRAGIPPEQMLRDRRDYQRWLDEELRGKVIAFFAQADAALDAPLRQLDPKESDAANRFKAAYLTRRDEIQEQLLRRCPGITLPRNLFAPHAWADSGDLPNRTQFKDITQDVNIRKHLLQLVAAAQAGSIQKIEIDLKKRQKDKDSGLCDRIPVLLEVIVPADGVAEFVRSFLQPGAQAAPCLALRKVTTERLGRPGTLASRAGVAVKLELDVLDFPDSLPAAKPEAKT